MNIKQLVNYMYECAEMNCDTWQEPYRDKFEAWELSHESTWLEDYEDMQEEYGVTWSQINEAIDIINAEVTKMTTKYIVETYTICDGWTNAWHTDGEPQTFPTYKQAEKELEDFFADISEAYEAEDLPDAYDREDYRIVALKRV